MLGGPRRNKSLGMLLNGHAITDQTRAKEAVKDTKVPSLEAYNTFSLYKWSVRRRIDLISPTGCQNTGSKGAARAVRGHEDANRRDARYGYRRGNHNCTLSAESCYLRARSHVWTISEKHGVPEELL
ncbi:hypothetical protein IG631_06928 [Alternaria alternata]|nr:hypothetical protein IG631_06928 [Alternaria alternata]